MVAKKKTVVRTVNGLSYKQTDKSYEICGGVSETIQGDALSIKEILTRHAHGLIDTTLTRQAVYDDEPEYDDPDYNEVSGMDPVDQEQIQEEVYAQEVESLKKSKSKEAETKTKNESDQDDDKKSSTPAETKAEQSEANQDQK